MADVLILAARRPARNGRGDQKSTWCAATGLSASGRHTVTIATLGLTDDEPDAGDALPGVTIVELGVAPARRVLATVAGLLRGLPAQTAWTTAGLRRSTVAALTRDHDVVLAITSRTLDRRWNLPTVIDHVDALSLNMGRRSKIDPSGLKRSAARVESRLLARHERGIARWVSSQMVTTYADAAALPPVPVPVILPPHREVSAAEQHVDPLAPRPIDLMLTGNMRYPPNRMAFERLAHEVLPALAATGRTVRTRVVGRAADSLPRVDGIEIASDVPNVPAALAEAKIAIAPVEGGTGAPNKLLEAASAGCAVVAPQWALDAFGVPLQGADGTAAMVRQIEALLDDPEGRRGNVAAFGDALHRSRPEVLAEIVEAELVRAVDQAD